MACRMLQGEARLIVSWHKDEEVASRIRTMKREVNKSEVRATMAQRRDGDQDGIKRRKVRIGGINAADDSKRDMEGRVARYVPDSTRRRCQESSPSLNVSFFLPNSSFSLYHASEMVSCHVMLFL